MTPRSPRGRRPLKHSNAPRARTLPCVIALALLCTIAFAFDAVRAESGGGGHFVMVIESSTFQLSVRDARSGERGPTIRVALGSPEQATPMGRFPLDRII